MPHGHFSADVIKANLGTRFMGQELHFYNTLPTTMDMADEKANAGTPEGTVVIADHQTAGRGRFDRTWITPKGDTIAVSVILRPTAKEVSKLHMAAALAVVRSIERSCGLSPRIKWPNDVLIDGKKVSGILLASSFLGDRLSYVNVGIGINVNIEQDIVSQISPPATSLSLEVGKPVSRLAVFCALMEELESHYLSLRRSYNILDQWKHYVVTLGQDVQIMWRREDLQGYVERGFAESVNEEGSLLLRLSDGTLKTLVAGEVTLHSSEAVY